MGMAGPVSDWLRTTYMSMGYYVRHGDASSTEFKALIGLLTSDPASPVLWNLFMADLVMLLDLDDVVMENVRIAMMAQADDVLLVSLSARGLRTKLNTLRDRCAKISSRSTC
jgi:hypothetical protein